jgi:hypothetical protein
MKSAKEEIGVSENRILGLRRCPSPPIRILETGKKLRKNCETVPHPTPTPGLGYWKVAKR